MKYSLLLILATTIFSLNLTAQKLTIGKIQDPDGYTNIRSGKGTNTDVVGRILEGEYVYFEESTDKSPWLKVRYNTYTCQEEAQSSQELTPLIPLSLSGYVHRSRIVESNLSSFGGSKVRLISILLMEKAFLEKRDSLILPDCYPSFYYFTFKNSLGDLTKELAIYQDLELFDLLNEVLILSSGSADEGLTVPLGELYVLNPEWTLKHMDARLIENLEWGFINVMLGDNDRREKLEERLNRYRESIGMKRVEFDNY